MLRHDPEAYGYRVIAFDAVVLAGGAGRRLDGADKPALEIGGRSMLAHVLGAVAGARRRIVVGPRREIDEDVRWCREDPPGGGPVAGLAVALPLSVHDIVVVLAADLPWIAPAVPLLIAGAADGDVAALADSSGRINFLAAAWRRDSLQRVLHAVCSRGSGGSHEHRGPLLTRALRRRRDDHRRRRGRLVDRLRQLGGRRGCSEDVLTERQRERNP